MLRAVAATNAASGAIVVLDDYTDPKGPTSLLQPEQDPLKKRLADISKLLEIDRDLQDPGGVCRIAEEPGVALRGGRRDPRHRGKQ